MAEGATRCLDVLTEEDDDKEMRIIFVGDSCLANKELQDAVKALDVEVVESETGLDFVSDAEEFNCAFVMEEFKGEIFEQLHKACVRIVGPPVIIRCAREKQPIPYNSRPQYCCSMTGLKVCFTGFKEKKTELCDLVDLVHYMGGNVRKELKTNITHLVANSIGGEKYQYAVGIGTPIMSSDWIKRVWTERDCLDFRADDSSVMKYKIPPFYQRCLSFLGFSKDEQDHMEEITIQNGGLFVAVGEEGCTHLIVDEAVKELPKDLDLPRHVVKGEWFWACIQMEACAAENMYTFHKAEIVHNMFTPTGSMSGSKSRKRKRLKENIAQLVSDEELESPLYNKRRSSDMCGINSPNSFLDASNTPDISDINIADKEPVKITPRLQVVREFLQTEKNYVGILHTLLHTFKEQVEKQDQYNGVILAAPDVKLIFGNITPIYLIHCNIRDELANMVDSWHDGQLVGTVISKHADALVKAYPPFVNFYEDTKERIQKCDKTNPRFHAFLKLQYDMSDEEIGHHDEQGSLLQVLNISPELLSKICPSSVCQTKPECGRQTLTELLIRPVQRLPSITLLLNDILKHTSKTNPDHCMVEKANSVLKEVMTHINEDKRRTESQVVMFDIMKDIENCPATLLSSHRIFETRMDVLELSDTLCERGAPLSLFLFSDCMVVCKRRRILLSKSPSTSKTPQKGYKHVEFVQLQSVKKVLDVVESDECKSAFGLVVKNIGEPMKDKLYTFMMDMEDGSKRSFLTAVSKAIANTTCRTDNEGLISCVECTQLNVNTLEIGNQSLSKAASRFSRRVSRAFSFNKTPRRIKRAVSHVFSPFVKDNREFTPGELRRNVMASTTDLTEDSISLLNFDDSQSDIVSLGGFSLKDM